MAESVAALKAERDAIAAELAALKAKLSGDTLWTTAAPAVVNGEIIPSDKVVWWPKGRGKGMPVSLTVENMDLLLSDSEVKKGRAFCASFKASKDFPSEAQRTKLREYRANNMKAARAVYNATKASK